MRSGHGRADPRGGAAHRLALGDAPILNIDLFAPARADYLFLTDHQPESRRS
jgi:hypothetical protein